MPEPVISVKNIAKEYRFYRSNLQRIKHELLGIDAGDRVPALADVTFDINKGEKVAIIGNVGAGRTTLMRIIGGMLRQDSGTVTVNGRLTTMYDNKMGFDGALTGLDNIRSKAALMGWSDEFLKENQDSIIEFADLSDVIHQPMRSYPSGSPGRLGFIMATTARPDILLYDENFMLGAQTQVDRCVNRLKELISDEDVTFMMVAMNHLIGRMLCSRGLVLHEGRIVFDGKYQDAIKYFKSNCKVDPEAEKGVKERTKAAKQVLDEASGDFDF